MTELRAYYDIEHAEEGVPVRTSDDLDTLLDRIHAESIENDWPVAFRLLVGGDPNTPEFAVGVQGDNAALYYSGREWPGVWYTTGADATTAGSSVYEILGGDVEFPDNALLPIATVRRALHQYLATGGDRPTTVDWHEAG